MRRLFEAVMLSIHKLEKKDTQCEPFDFINLANILPIQDEARSSIIPLDWTRPECLGDETFPLNARITPDQGGPELQKDKDELTNQKRNAQAEEPAKELTADQRIYPKPENQAAVKNTGEPG